MVLVKRNDQGVIVGCKCRACGLEWKALRVEDCPRCLAMDLNEELESETAWADEYHAKLQDCREAYLRLEKFAALYYRLYPHDHDILGVKGIYPRNDAWQDLEEWQRARLHPPRVG